ncbi:Acyl carrier protein phosphodiesterase [Spirosomataceae bacterium TFI 002]|nr:Acyl carrier protein phosphodiesterase [Spirosomataceae bacterium TFI 002]
MNYLAHVFLSGDDPEVLIGNILEDFTKGRIDHPRNDIYSPNIKVGLGLHRLIDHYIDTSSLIKDIKELFYPSFSKYTPAVLDVLFDYFLIKNWETYSDQNFDEFRLITYQKFEDNWEKLPDSMRKLVRSMIEYDWLKEYGTYESLTYVMGRFSIKAKTDYDFRKAVPIMIENEKYINDIFNKFFPLMIFESEKFLKTNLK